MTLSTAHDSFFNAIPAALAVICLAAVGWAGEGPLYPDFAVTVVSDNHIIVRYSPRFSDDFIVLDRGDLLPTGGMLARGRSFLVAVPPTGEVDFSADYAVAGYAALPDSGAFAAAATPLVSLAGYVEARGHRLARFDVFPQRSEEGRLTAYKDFVIDITFPGAALAPMRESEISRLDTVLAATTVNGRQFFTLGAASRIGTMRKPSATPFDDRAQWIKISVAEEGVTRITGAMLAQAGIALSDLRTDSLRIFYAGGRPPADDPREEEAAFDQVAVRVEDGGDGRFDAADALYFFAEGPKRFEYTSATPTYYANPYDPSNVYWLAVGGYDAEPAARWAIEDATPTGTPDAVASVERRFVRVEQNHLLKTEIDGHIRDYATWYWSDQATVGASVNLPQAVTGDSIDIELGAAGEFSRAALNVNGVALSRYSAAGKYHFWDKSGAAVAGLNTIQVNLQPLGSYVAYLDYLTVSYARRLTYVGGQMEMNSLGRAGWIRYEVTGYTTSNLTLDITDPDHPALVSGVEISGDTARFQLAAVSETPSRFLIFPRSAALSPTSLTMATVGGLRRDLNQYDCLVIAPEQFLTALQPYADYRLAESGKRVKLAAVEDIYDDFGFGLSSPMAIRDYLAYAYEHYAAPAPYAALLVGDGHYDFQDYLGLHVSSYIPPYVWTRENSVGDDNYVYFGRLTWLDSDSSYVNVPDRGWDMMIARWPVRSPGEVAAYIDKVKSYESPETRGIWRSRATFVADDEYKGSYTGEILHTAQAETLAVFHTPAALERQKIYATDYPFASNGEKPTVNDAIVKAVNGGTLLVDYVGHGSPDVWADEHILKKGSDLSRMQNPDKLAVFVAASCSIGQFDAPDREGMAELLFRQTGGAIATVSATRLVYASDNSVFNYDLYDFIFGGDYNITEAAFATKLKHQYERPYDAALLLNDRSYLVFGDVLGTLGLPRHRLEIVPGGDSVLTPLRRYDFTGRVVDEQGTAVPFDGPVEVSVSDSPATRVHRLGLVYSLDAPTIFRGTVTAEGGEFAGSFIVPLDVDYGGKASRIFGYGAFTSGAALGGLDSLPVASAAAVTDDNAGPTITVGFSEVPEFVSGDRVPAGATLVVGLSDSSGINLTGGLGHRIELVVDNDNSATLNLTDRFAYREGDFRSGEVDFTLPDLSAGRHQFKITAWDNANNPAVAEYEATIAEKGRLGIAGLLNYPNPMEGTTEFFFELTGSANEVELQIFTLAGRMIKRFSSDDPRVGRNRLFLWDGRDADGDRVAQGVYIYKLTASGPVSDGGSSTDNKAEAFGKLVVLN